MTSRSEGIGSAVRPDEGGLMTVFGYFLACEEHSPRELIRQARLAEQAGFEKLWISDHFHPWLGEQGQSPFVWSVIGALSQATSLPVTRYDLMVEALGGRGALVREPGDIAPALARALASDEVWCVNVVLDPAAYRRTGTVSMAI